MNSLSFLMLCTTLMTSRHMSDARLIGRAEQHKSVVDDLRRRRRPRNGAVWSAIRQFVAERHRCDQEVRLSDLRFRHGAPCCAGSSPGCHHLLLPMRRVRPRVQLHHSTPCGTKCAHQVRHCWWVTHYA